MPTAYDTLRRLEEGVLICLSGPEQGTVWSLGQHGLSFAPSKGWHSFSEKNNGRALHLFKYDDFAQLQNNGYPVRILGEEVEESSKIPVNGKIEVGSSTYRVYFLAQDWQTVQQKEQTTRREVHGATLNGMDHRSSTCLPSFEVGTFIDFLESVGVSAGQYEDSYLEAPLDTIRRQNHFLKSRASTDRQDSAREFLMLNASIEAQHFPQSENKTENTYDELHNVQYFAQNDYLPGHKFVLGDQTTYNREKLRIDKTSSSLHADSDQNMVEFFVRSKLVGADLGDDWLKISLKLFFELTRCFSPQPNKVEHQDSTLVLQDFFDQGGVCRHKCAVLQIALQEAGISSRYLRGKLFFGGYHAWNEVDIFQDGSYALILDPHKQHVMIKSGTLETSVGAIYLRDEGYPITPHFNTVWRGKRAKVYNGTPAQTSPAQPTVSARNR